MLVYNFLKNGPTPATFSFIFGLFKQTLQFLQQIYVKKCPSSIQCRDLNPRRSEHESFPITTRPGLPPKFTISSFKCDDECHECGGVVGEEMVQKSVN